MYKLPPLPSSLSITSPLKRQREDETSSQYTKKIKQTAYVDKENANPQFLDSSNNVNVKLQAIIKKPLQITHQAHNNITESLPANPLNIAPVSIIAKTNFSDSEATTKEIRTEINNSTEQLTVSQNAPAAAFEVTDPMTLESRQKMIDKGKYTVGYANYCKLVPKETRKIWQPRTPDIHKYRRRCFVGLVQVWRRQLHEYDNITTEEEYKQYMATNPEKRFLRVKQNQKKNRTSVPNPNKSESNSHTSQEGLEDEGEVSPVDFSDDEGKK